MKTAINDTEKEMLAKMAADEAQEQHFQTPSNGDEIAEKALQSIIANKGKLDHFHLAMIIKSMGGDMLPSACKAFLSAKGYQEGGEGKIDIEGTL